MERNTSFGVPRLKRRGSPTVTTEVHDEYAIMAALRSAKPRESRARHISGESPMILPSYSVPLITVMLRI